MGVDTKDSAIGGLSFYDSVRAIFGKCKYISYHIVHLRGSVGMGELIWRIASCECFVTDVSVENFLLGMKGNAKGGVVWMSLEGKFVWSSM